MNKYQEALDFLRDHAMEYIEDFDWEENDCGEYYPLDKDVLYANKSVLQELVDKATPKIAGMEVELGSATHLAGNVVCPYCKRKIINLGAAYGYYPKYCCFCGQALDWSDDQ